MHYLFDFCVFRTCSKEESVLEPYECHRSQSWLVAFGSGKEDILLSREPLQHLPFQQIAISFQDVFLRFLRISVCAYKLWEADVSTRRCPPQELATLIGARIRILKQLS